MGNHHGNRKNPCRRGRWLITIGDLMHYEKKTLEEEENGR
jgi:hypothetical protein